MLFGDWLSKIRGGKLDAKDALKKHTQCAALQLKAAPQDADVSCSTDTEHVSRARCV